MSRVRDRIFSRRTSPLSNQSATPSQPVQEDTPSSQSSPPDDADQALIEYLLTSDDDTLNQIPGFGKAMIAKVRKLDQDTATPETVQKILGENRYQEAKEYIKTLS